MHLISTARLFALAAPFLLATTALAQQAQDPGPNAPVSYELSFDNAAQREARIAVTYRDLKPGAVEFRMARSSPGRYAIHEFAKNVYSVSAKDGAGRTLKIDRSDPYSWRVSGHDGTVTFSYTLYGDRGDGTYSQIDQTHAHLNMPATLIWAAGYDDRPIRVTFRPADPKWKIATQLAPVSGSATTFWAPHLQYLLDSPTELSDHHLREWTISSGGKTQTIRLAVHSADTPETIDAYAEKAKKVVAEQIRIFGTAPDFDFGTYTFIADYVPQISGDGMEHRNSTIISQSRSLAAGNFAQLGTLSHEFIHAWNVERLRPAELEPFDFTQADPTPSLWFAEGFTQYYGPLAIRRSGEMPLDAYLASLGGTLDFIVNNSARRYGSPQEMSLRAPFVDAAASIDPVNERIFASYYPYGAVVALALDLTLRQRGSDLDAYMRHLWQRNGAAQRNFAPAKPYTPADLEAGLAELTRDPAFAKAFFDAHIRGSALPDFAPLLAKAGLVLRPADASRAWIGTSNVTGGGDEPVRLGEIPVPGSPLYAAGLTRGDTITALDGKPIATPADFRTALAALKPGQPAAITFATRAGPGSATLTPQADPKLAIMALERTGGTPTPAQIAFRRAWLGSD
ncbi:MULTISPECIES: M61 family metallopeptidase [unclassified Sphingomonas]|uniref:M61 family metallopeptidase n=1 Tax=unclassified Sphingomonas TaxID=196159 RepID=UPI000830D4F4|nr:MULTISPECIES: PDZ domain-containing protein [unclassified Sphingomonas]